MQDFFAALVARQLRLLGSDALYLVVLSQEPGDRGALDALLLLIGYPDRLRHGARAARAGRPLLVMLVILPFWTSFLIRVYAWIAILKHDGLLNQVLLALGIIDEPPVWLATDTAVYIGIVYSYLPFMVLPLYATLEKLDATLLEAAADLGCPRWKAFWLVTVAAVAARRRRRLRCSASSRSSASSSSPTCSAAPTR